jgi:hypothetical protein
MVRKISAFDDGFHVVQAEIKWVCFRQRAIGLSKLPRAGDAANLAVSIVSHTAQRTIPPSRFGS